MSGASAQCGGAKDTAWASRFPWFWRPRRIRSSRNTELLKKWWTMRTGQTQTASRRPRCRPATAVPAARTSKRALDRHPSACLRRCKVFAFLSSLSLDSSPWTPSSAFSCSTQPPACCSSCTAVVAARWKRKRSPPTTRSWEAVVATPSREGQRVRVDRKRRLYLRSQKVLKDTL